MRTENESWTPHLHTSAHTPWKWCQLNSPITLKPHVHSFTPSSSNTGQSKTCKDCSRPSSHRDKTLVGRHSENSSNFPVIPIHYKTISGGLEKWLKTPQDPGEASGTMWLAHEACNSSSMRHPPLGLFMCGYTYMQFFKCKRPWVY